MLAQTNPAISSGELASLLGRWSESAHGTLAQRLGRAVREAVAAGLLTDGTRLPPERALAAAFAVSRSTVTAAFDDLRADGLLESRQGSGTIVRTARRGPDPAPLTSTRIAEAFTAWGGIDLSTGNPPDPSHWPALSIDVADLIADGGGPGVQPLGLPSLRSALAERHTSRKRLTQAAEIHVTSGAHQAIALLVRASAGPGATVVLEDPSYPGIFDIVDAVGARALPVEFDGAGIVPEALERVLRKHRPAVVYLQNGPHNPTGRVPKPGRLRALAQVLDAHPDTVVIEDTALADLTFAGRTNPELADLCRRTVVATVGSFSKVAWGGLRVGWLRAPAPLVERTMQLRLATDLGTSVPAQLLALQLLPHLDGLAERRRAALADLTARAVAQLRVDLPEWDVHAPGGGSVLWARLPVDDSGPFVQLAARLGVHVAPGSIARVDRADDPHVRICVDRPWEHVDAGLQRLLHTWHELTRRPAPVVG